MAADDSLPEAAAAAAAAAAVGVTVRPELVVWLPPTPGMPVLLLNVICNRLLALEADVVGTPDPDDCRDVAYVTFDAVRGVWETELEGDVDEAATPDVILRLVFAMDEIFD